MFDPTTPSGHSGVPSRRSIHRFRHDPAAIPTRPRGDSDAMPSQRAATRRGVFRQRHDRLSAAAMTRARRKWRNGTAGEVQRRWAAFPHISGPRRGLGAAPLSRPSRRKLTLHPLALPNQHEREHSGAELVQLSQYKQGRQTAGRTAVTTGRPADSSSNR